MDKLLIKTKICKPLSRDNAVPRTKLAEILKAGAQKNLQLSLLSAPPGYGKTSLVTEWLANTDLDAAWFLIDKADNEPVRFFSYLIGTLKNMEKDIGAAALSLLEAPMLPPTEILVGSLINDILSSSRRFILVLDDFQNIHNAAILEAVQFILDNQPHNMHLVIITRVDPSLSLSRLRGRGQITEIRENDLRFTKAESVIFLNSTMKLDLTEDYIRQLTEKTEGWVAGLLLAALSIGGKEPSALMDFIEDFAGTQQYILDYLLEELLSSLKEDIRDFLIKSSILDSFNASLCVAVTGRPDSSAILNMLYKSNIFIERLNEAGQWYRYHNLFRDILKSELKEGQDSLLHNKALHWYEENEMYEMALVHAAEAKNYDALERLITKTAWSFIERGEAGTLERWIRELPVERLDQNPELKMFKAWELLLMGKGKESSRLISTVDLVSLANQKPEIRINLLILQIYKSINIKDIATLKLAEEAEKLLEYKEPSVRTAAFYYVAQIRSFQGRLEESIECYYQAYHTAMMIKRYFIAVISAKNLAVTLLLCGRKSEAMEVCQMVRENIADGKGKLLSIAELIYIPIGMVHYLGDELSEAKEYLEKGVNLCRSLSLIHFAVQGEMNLAELQSAMGNQEAAIETINKSCKTLKEIGLDLGMQMYSGVEVEFRLRMGQLDYALSWAEKMQLTTTHNIDHLNDRIYLTYARILIATGSYKEARLILEKLSASAKTGNRILRSITVYILTAVLSLKEGNREEAANQLGEAVRIASNEGYYILFLEEDPAIEDLLPSLKPIAPLFVEELIKKYRVKMKELKIEKTPPVKSSAAMFIDPLSEREIEVLKLVAAGNSNSEIAEKLFISVGTTKWHITNIFSKLNVKNRVQAIEAAKEYLK